MADQGGSSDGAAEGGDAKTCEHCGTTIETADWYPVASERDEDGSLALYHFCSEDCRSAWRGADSG